MSKSSDTEKTPTRAYDIYYRRKNPSCTTPWRLDGDTTVNEWGENLSKPEADVWVTKYEGTDVVLFADFAFKIVPHGTRPR